MSEMDSPASRRFSVDGKPNSPLGKKLSSPMSSASQVEEGKPKYSKDELAEFRQKTIARLIDKRRADEGNKVKAIEEEKQLDKMFRSKWRETVKAKKLNAVISEVDKKILKQTIQTEPEVIARLVAREPSSSIDTSLEGLLEGLNDCDGEETVCKKTGRNSNRSSFSNNTNDYVVSKVRNSDRFFLSDKIGTTSSSATQFLRNSVTYKMTINERIRKHSIQEVGRARSDSTDLKSSLGVSGTPNHRLFSSYENEMNLISLLGKLLDDQYTVDGEENVPRKIIKTTGLMAKFIQKSRLPLQVSTNGNQDMNNLNSLCSPVHRAQSFFSNTRMHSRSSADRSLSDAGFFPEIVPAKSTNNMLTQVDDQLFCSLVEKVFLLGPSKRDIESLMFANLGDDSSNVDFPSTLDNNNDGIKVLKEKTRIVDSKILFMTEKDDFEVLSLLPSFSFPSGVEINIGLSEKINLSKPRSLSRRHSILGATSSSGSPKLRRKSARSLFPSGNSMVDIESGADKQRRASSSALNDLRDAKVTVEDSSFKSSSPTKGMRSPFVLLLFATHEYCVCQQLPMTFRYPDIGVSITTTYVVILKTKLPVFNYLYAVLDQFESIFNGLDFVEPLEVQELDMPVPAELRLISELGYKLKKVITPIYPYMLDDKSIRRLESEEVLEGIFPTGSYQASQLTALFPEIEFFMSKNQRKIDIIFNRNTYIPFYSSYNSAKSVSSKAIKDLMTNYYSRRPNGLFPDAIQKFEREREDSFMILMWALPTLLKYLPLDQIVLAIGCALSEMKCILVKHKDFQVISSAVFALVHLLRPLHWCGNVVVILPDSLLDLIESPVPIIIGVNKLPEGFVLLEGFVVVDLQDRIVHLNPADVVVSHTILLPHGSKLVHTLRPHADTILRLTKRKRRTKKLDLINSSFAYEQINNNKASMAGIEHPSTPSGSSTSKRMSGRLSTSRLASYESNPGLTTVLAEVSGAVASHNAKLSLPKAPLPVELDANSTENDILLSAMRSFTSLTASHMEAIINTSIQIQYKAREAEKEKRRLLIKNDANSKMGVKPTLSRAYTTPSPAPEISTSPKSNTITKFNLEMNDAAAKAAHMLINSTSIPPSKAASRRVSKASEGLQQSIDAIVSDKNAMFPESTHNAIEITSKGDEDCAPFEKSNSLFSENVNIFEDLGFDIKVPNNLIRQSLPPQKIFTSNTLAFGNDDSATAKVSSLELRANSRRSSASAGETVDGVHLTSGIAKDQLVTGSPVRNMVATDAADVKVNLPESKFSAITDVSDEIQVAVESNDLNSSSPNSVAAYNAMKNEEDRTKSSDQSLGDNNIDLSKITSSEEDMSEISASEHYNRGNLADETRSISSSASSLPSLRMNAPLLAFKEIGEGGARFLSKFSETQMFTNYCLYLKQEPPDRGIFEETFVDDKSVDGSESEFSEETSSQNDQIKSQNALSTARGPHKILKRLKSRRLVNGKVLRKARAALDADKANDYAERSLRSQWSDFEEVELDALTALFESILTGTVAVRNSQISEMIGRYSKLYNESKATNQELLVGMDSLLSCAGKSFNLTNSQTFYRSTQVHYVAAIAEDSGASDTEISPASVRTDSSRIVPNGNLPWCNGLFCNGYCNTAFCTGICLRLWEKKVQILRKRLLLKDILKKHNAGFKFKKPLAKDLAIKVFAAPSSHNVEGSNTNASEMVPSVVKHSKETSSQYHQRQSIHDPTLAGNSWNKKRTTDKKNSLKDCSLGPFVVSRRFAEIDRYYDEKQFIAKGGKRLYYARKGIASKSTFIIAQYYIRQQNRLKIMQRKKAIRTLKTILLRFIWLYRKIVFLDSIVYIQSVVRGFLVRNKIAELVEALIARKIRRLLATIRIRRFLRIFSSDIAVRWENKKAQQFRKRSITSLPISKNGNGEKRLTNRISFIHDDINDEAANAIFNKPVEATPGGKYEYVAPSASTTDINKCASINSSIVESSPKASVPINSGSPLRLGHKRAVSHDNAFMEKQNSIKAGKKESQLSKGYRDFLQFGTILRRPASYTKNKERVHAKNNSISAIVIPSMLGSNKLNITNEIAAQALNLEDKPVATASKPGLNTYSSKISADKHAISLQPPSKYAESELAESAKSNPCTTLSPIKEDSDHGRISEENVINDCHSLKLDTSIDMTWSLSEKVESAPAHYQVNNYNSTDSPPNTGDNSSSVSPNSKVTSPIPYVECDYDSSDGEENTVEDEKSFYKFRKVRQKIKANTGKVQSKRPSHARNISALTDPSSTSGASVASSTGSAQQVNEIYIRDLNVASVDTESNQNQVNSSAHSRVNSLKGLFASIPEDTSISPEVNGDNRKSLSYDLSDGSATVDKAIESEALDTPRIANSESLQPFLSVSIDSIDTVRRKRITPIARYAADHNYALSKIVSQPVSNSLSQRTSFSPMSTSRSASIDGVEDSAMTGAISARSLSTLESDNISKSFGDGISRARGNTSRLFNRKQAMAKKIASLKVSPVKDPTINDTSFSSAKDLFVERVVETVSPLKDVPQSSTVDDRFDDEDEEEDEDNMHDIAHNLTKAKGEPPLKYMNPEVLETFLPQQLTILLDMWRDLRAGIDIYKHGRSGKPKERVLFCDLSMTKLYWRAPGASLDPDMDDEALLEDSHDPKRKTSYDDSNHDSSNYRKEKHVNRRSSFAKSDSDRVVYFKDIISVSNNYETEVMQRSLAKNYVSPYQANTIVSILLTDRSLDFVIDEQTWTSLFNAMRIMLLYHDKVRELETSGGNARQFSLVNSRSMGIASVVSRDSDCTITNSTKYLASPRTEETEGGQVENYLEFNTVEFPHHRRKHSSKRI